MADRGKLRESARPIRGGALVVELPKLCPGVGSEIRGSGLFSVLEIVDTVRKPWGPGGLEGVVGVAVEGAEGVGVCELEEGGGLGAFDLEGGFIDVEVEGGVVPLAVEAQADEEVLDVVGLFAGDALADDPVAIFHEEEFVGDPVGEGTGGGGGLEAGGLSGDQGNRM